MSVEDKYSHFIKRLQYFQSERLVKILKRGVTKDFAFKLFLLDTNLNTLEQFAKKLFYFGEKSRYFWEKKVDNSFKIGETDSKVFNFIFSEFKKIANKNEVKLGTQRFKAKNIIAFDYFSNESNRDIFKRTANSIEELDKRKYINYYLRILHQLREFGYENQSINISSTEKESTAQGYAKNEIIIDFWDFDFNHFVSPNISMPTFIGKPYKKQKEISVFGVIFPQYIHSFRCGGDIYYNPAMFNKTNVDFMILSGFDIDQSDFDNRFRNETINKTALRKTWETYKEIN